MSAPSFRDAAVVELRQYTLRPGALGDLLGVFEGELVEPQEAVGMSVGGLYADRDDPDRFVWMRGFNGLEPRRRALEAFYDGPVWAEHAATANATMLDSDDVLLLRPTDPPHPPLPPAGDRLADAGPVESDEWVVATTWLHEPDEELAAWLSTTAHSLLESSLEVDVATWRTESATNTFPRLPVRPDHAFVWLASFTDEASYRAAEAGLRSMPAWREQVAPRLARHVCSTEELRLQPTRRSQHPLSGHAGRP